MSVVPDRRRIAVLDGGRRVDLALPPDGSLGDALRVAGIPIGADRALVGRNGQDAELGGAVAETPDGEIFAVIELTAAPERVGRRMRAERNVERAGHGSGWWALAAVAAIAVIADVAAGGALDPLARTVLAAAIGAGALVAGVVWARRSDDGPRSTALPMIGPLALAAVAGAIATGPDAASGPQLAVTVALLAAAVLAAVLVVTLRGHRLRAGASIAAGILGGLAVVWGATLMADWGLVAAAAISAGAVPPVLRALPSTLLDVPEGYSIDYARHMSSRWTVRGAIPADPGPVRMPGVQRIVTDSAARLGTGTALLSAVAAGCAPVVLGARTSDPVVLGGVIALVVTLTLALLLIPRRSATPVVRWLPRAAAAVVATTGVIGVLPVLGVLPGLLLAGGLLGVGVVAAFVVVPVAQGARSLAWSRVADIVEALAVAVALPAGLLAADALSLLRGMMAG